MWPKNATIYGISPKANFPIEQLQAARFVPATSSELMTSGFSPVRGDELAYKHGKHTLLRFTIEKKHIPASAVAVMLEERCVALEEQQGFRPGKKAMKDLKERIIDELLPRALATRRSTLIWIDQDQHRIVVDTASNSTADDVLRALIKAFAGLVDLGFQDTGWPRAKVLNSWVVDEPPTDFTVDDAVVLQHPGENGTLVKFERAHLDSNDVQLHLGAGASVQALAMTFNSRISFIMTQNMQLRKIKPLDILKEGADAEKDVDRFDSDVALMTRELGVLIDSLVQAA